MARRVEPRGRRAHTSRRLTALSLVAGLVATSACLDPPDQALAKWNAASTRFIAYGDSFTSGGGFDAGHNWATGTAPETNSVLTRLQETFGDAVGRNAAHPGARMSDLAAQVAAGPPDAYYVAILLGLNDVCTAGFDARRFGLEATRAFQVVHTFHPHAAVVVYAIPDVTQLHSIHASIPRARDVWSQASYCTDALGADASAQSVDRARARFAQADDVLAGAARASGFVFSTSTSELGFSAADLSTVDFLHPSDAGEARLADAAWAEIAAITRPVVPLG